MLFKTLKNRAAAPMVRQSFPCLRTSNLQEDCNGSTRPWVCLARGDVNARKPSMPADKAASLGRMLHGLRRRHCQQRHKRRTQAHKSAPHSTRTAQLNCLCSCHHQVRLIRTGRWSTREDCAAYPDKCPASRDWRCSRFCRTCFPA